jgi:membrane-associated phospholipid phosphatase
MRKIVGVMACAGVLVASSPGEAKSLHHWDQASTVTAGAIAALALGIPLLQSDEAGLAQAGLSMAAGTGTAFALKSLVDERRPDGSDYHSFPSGHASFSFAAAAFLENRYGWQVGLPAFALATFVGTARVEAKRHHWYDVAAGAAIGSASGFLLTHRDNQPVDISAWGGHGGGGLKLSTRF